MGYIDRPVDWLQYALKIRAYTNFLIKLWWFENWECATGKSVTVRAVWARAVQRLQRTGQSPADCKRDTRRPGEAYCRVLSLTALRRRYIRITWTLLTHSFGIWESKQVRPAGFNQAASQAVSEAARRERSWTYSDWWGLGHTAGSFRTGAAPLHCTGTTCCCL